MNPRTLSYCFTAFLCVLIISSCQKAYERPDITLTGNTGGSGGSGTGGGGSTTGKLLIRSEQKTTGNTPEGSVTTYEYDANDRMSRMVIVSTDSFNKVTTSAFFYKRDAAGRVIRVSQSTPPNALAGTPGIPDSLFVDIHYPSPTSTQFDYFVSRNSFLGLDYLDSSYFTYSNGLLIRKGLRSSYSFSSMVIERNFGYKYNADGNLAEITEFASGSTTIPMLVQSATFNDKPNPLPSGFEAFLPGRSEFGFGKNNFTKVQAMYNSGTSMGVVLSLNFVFEYNSNNLPVTGTSTTTGIQSKTQTLKYFYK